MARKDIDTLIRRAKDAHQQKELWQDELEDVYDYAMPNRNLYDEEAPGDSKTEKIYDSEAIHSLKAFAARLQNKLTPPFEQWFDLKMGPQVKQQLKQIQQKLRIKGVPKQKAEKIVQREEKKVKEKLQFISDMVTNVLNTGTFNSSIHELYLDLATGQGAMLVLPGKSKDRPVKYTTVNRHDYAIQDNADNQIEFVCRKIKVRAPNIKKQWPDADIPKELKDKIDDGDHDDKIEFWEVTYEGQREDSSSPLDRVWYYDIIWKGGDDEDNNSRIVERQYEHNPWIIARWSKLATENEGRGPLLDALPDIRTVNKVVEFILKNASLAISGVYTVTQDNAVTPGNIKLEPGAFIPVNSNGGRGQGASIQPLQTGNDLEFGQLVADDIRERIKDALFNNSVPNQRGKTPNSAAEIVQRTEELQQQMKGSFGRLFKELLVPLIQRTIDILSSNDMIDIPIKIDTVGVKLVVTSPLAQKQNMEDVRRVARWVDMVMKVAGEQGLVSKVDVDAVIEYFADKFGVKQDFVKDEQDKRQMMQQMKKLAQRAQQQQMQQAQGQAPAPQGGGEAPTPQQAPAQ